MIHVFRSDFRKEREKVTLKTLVELGKLVKK